MHLQCLLRCVCISPSFAHAELVHLRTVAPRSLASVEFVLGQLNAEQTSPSIQDKIWRKPFFTPLAATPPARKKARSAPYREPKKQGAGNELHTKRCDTKASARSNTIVCLPHGHKQSLWFTLRLRIYVCRTPLPTLQRGLSDGKRPCFVPSWFLLL